MKKIKLAVITALVLCACTVAFAACASGDKKDFIGDFTSTWVEGDGVVNVDYDNQGKPTTTQVFPEYKLSIKDDKTFSLEYTIDGESEFVRAGTWAEKSGGGEYGIVCFGESTTYSGQAKNNFYFTLTILDDGRIVASAGMASGFGTSTGEIVVFSRV